MNRVFSALASVFFLALAATAQTTNALSDAEVKGQELAQQLCEIQPGQNLTNSGVMEIHDEHGLRTNIPIVFEVSLAPTNWQSVYTALATNCYRNGFRLPYLDFNCLKIIHAANQPDEYSWKWQQNIAINQTQELANKNQANSLLLPSNGSGVVSGSFGDFRVTRHELHWTGTKFLNPFQPSDFWAVDLGLEFFHWPGQKVIKHEERRTRECTVLESTNPNPAPGAYSRVDSWIDDESLGLIHAEAYDANGKLLKIFDPKKIKKVNGQWELEDMEIRNAQTGSRTWIKFDLSQ